MIRNIEDLPDNESRQISSDFKNDQLLSKNIRQVKLC